MSGHVYVVVSGFQRRIIPSAAPYRVTRDRERIRVEVEVVGGWRSAVYEPASETSDDVADAVAGPDWNDWWLETTRYRIPFPDGWTAHASGTVDPVAFDLVSPEGAMIYVQTPRVLPSAQSLASHGELRRTWNDHTGDWLDVSYVRNGATWIQRYCVRVLDESPIVITAQAETSSLARTMECHARIATDIRAGSE
jgi:hypothetical protein